MVTVVAGTPSQWVAATMAAQEVVVVVVVPVKAEVGVTMVAGEGRDAAGGMAVAGEGGEAEAGQGE